ncbi:MAG: UDP-N-acetylmuramoyl-L-alanyl-D-glutamate--2,6-diaminopimelate ligase [Finegoldia sp.]|nr:UDP-N-acetylmuramoyl-L-alanyl-D-glutamate--2,6-diaminopimelate ligase [Finegoldia sp.]
MKVEDLIKKIDPLDYTIASNDDLSFLTSDSRKVKQGSVFVAIEGYETDGHIYIDKAIEKGAGLIVHTKDIEKKEGISYAKVKNSRVAFAEISNILSDNPSKKMTIVGVTGTNGKTTTSFLIYFLLKKLTGHCANIGTNGAYLDDDLIESSNTTPEIDEINSILTDCLNKGIKNCVIEASSHALSLHRVDGIDFDYAVFTNLSTEHMDFHKTMENYFQAKMNLLDLAKKQVVNIDDDYGKRAKERFANAITIGIENPSDYRAEEIERQDSITRFKVSGVPFTYHRIATYDIYNALCAIAIVNDLGYSMEDISKALETYKGINSRFEFVENDLNRNIVIDFAHTPKAFENIYKAIPKNKKIYAVYGINGDRVREIREEVGKISAKNDVFSVVTTDDPKFDTYENIADDIVRGIESENGSYIRIKDRKQAMVYALKNSKPGDYILLLGKGQENFMKLKGNEKTPYSEKETLKEAIEQVKTGL